MASPLAVERELGTVGGFGGELVTASCHYFPDVQLKNPQTIPAKVGLLGNDNAHVYGGDGHWCVEKPDHRLLCWGDNYFGQISSGPCRPGMMDARSCPLLEVKFDRECE